MIYSIYKKNPRTGTASSDNYNENSCVLGLVEQTWNVAYSTGTAGTVLENHRVLESSASIVITPIFFRRGQAEDAKITMCCPRICDEKVSAGIIFVCVSVVTFVPLLHKKGGHFWPPSGCFVTLKLRLFIPPAAEKCFHHATSGPTRLDADVLTGVEQPLVPVWVGP